MTTDYTIYSFTSTINGDCYVGSTRDLSRRLSEHISNYKRGGKQKLYNMIDNTPNGWADIDIVEVDTITGTESEARALEEHYRSTTNANMNQIRCHITAEEKADYARHYYEKHKQAITQIRREHYKKNAVKIIEKAVIRYHANKAEIIQKKKEARLQSPLKFKEYSRKYYNKHRDTILESSNLYYANNRDAILEKKKKQYLERKSTHKSI